jgi:UDP-glucose 4-epimerase
MVERLLTEDPERIVVIDNLYLGQIENLPECRVVRMYRRDLCQKDELAKIFREESIEIVYNLAVHPVVRSLELPESTYWNNVQSVLNLCELQRQDLYETLVHFSSSEAYGTALKVPMQEDHPLNPMHPYGASKAAGDQLILAYRNAYATDSTIVRPFNTYGPRQNIQGGYVAVIPMTICRTLQGQKPIVHGDGRQTRDLTYVTDIVDGALRAYKVSSTRGKVLNLCSGREVAIRDLMNEICDLMGWREGIDSAPRRQGDVTKHCGDSSLARALLEWRPTVSLRDGLQKTIEYYRRIRQMSDVARV